jgi:threonine dehydrogenase-like Zn-dependent dehydrogenase
VDARGKRPRTSPTNCAPRPRWIRPVFDSVGGRSFELGLGLREKGMLVNMAVHDLDIPVNFVRLGSERRITTSSNFATGDYPLALSWLESGRFVVKDWLTEIKLEDIPRVFAEAETGGRRAFKLVIRFR